MVGEVIVIAAEQVGTVRQTIVVAVETRRQDSVTAIAQEKRVVADAQHLIRRNIVSSDVPRIICERTHVGRNVSRSYVVVGNQVILRNVILCGQGALCHVACIIDESGHVGRDLRHGVHRDVARIVIERTHIRGNVRHLRKVGQIVVAAAETVGRVARIQRIRHAQQLLRALNGVVGAAVRVGLGLQKVRTVGPVDGGEVATEHRAAANLQRHQTVDVGGGDVGLLVNHGAVHTTLKDGDTHAHRTPHEGVGLVAHHCLVREFLRGLGEAGRDYAEKQRQGDKDFFHVLLFWLFDYSIMRGLGDADALDCRVLKARSPRNLAQLCCAG